MKNSLEKVYFSESHTIPNQAISVRDAVESTLTGNTLGISGLARDVKYDDDDAEYPNELNSLGIDLDQFQVMMTEQTRKASEAKRIWRAKKEAEAKSKKEAESKSDVLVSKAKDDE